MIGVNNKTLKAVFPILLIAVGGFALRAPFFSIPLDYDEGTYAFFAFFSRGERFYSSLPIGRLPGILLTFRFLDNFFPGQIAAFRIASALLVVLAAFLIYKLGRLLFGNRVGIFSSLIFLIFSSQISTDSPANTEFFMMPFIVFSAYFFWRFFKSRELEWLVFSGLCSGVAIFYKQVTIFEIGFFGLWLILEDLKSRRTTLLRNCFIFGISVAAPFLIAAIYFFLRGEWFDFWWQSFGSGGRYVRYAWEGWKWFDRFKGTARYLWSSFWPLWLLVSGGLALILIRRREKSSLFLVGWAIFSLAGVFFNGWFFPHYFVQAIPSVSFLAGFFIDQAFEIKKLRLLLVLSLLLILLSLEINQLFISVYYLRFLRNDIGRIEYYKRLGIDTGEAGWLPFYDSAEYLREQMVEEDTLFVWGTTPVPYYLTRKYPTTSFVQNYPLLDYKFMLPTTRGWEFDFINNRKELIKELLASPPTYILMHVDPEHIFDQMYVFGDFSNFLVSSYNFETQFGNILIFKNRGDRLSIDEGSTAIPLEIIKRFSAIIESRVEGKMTRLVFEPMVNPDGVLRKFEVEFPEPIEINFKPISTKFLGQDGNDFVSSSVLKSSGSVDLHLRVKGLLSPVSFARVKMGDLTWNSKSYGVNPIVGFFEKNEGEFDFYFEPPPDWEGKKTIEIYIIYEDGSLAMSSVGVD